MSAILTADSLNDFISPSLACIKPVETLPAAPTTGSDAYEVTTEDKVQASSGAPPAHISLTDCLACSGCVTSAEAVLVSLQSFQEVLSTLDAYPELPLPDASHIRDPAAWRNAAAADGKIFVASVSPQSRASIAASFGVSQRAAGNMVARLLSGNEGVRSGGQQGSGFAYVLDTNVFRDVGLVAAVDEVERAKVEGSRAGDFTVRDSAPKKPVLSSACPGWICYAEKTHPHVLPHISKVKSPQALAGTLVKSVLARKFGVPPDKIWHMAVMPCFDKKLEASREELTDVYWSGEQASESDAVNGTATKSRGARDVDLVITARELLSLAESRGINFPALSHRPLSRAERVRFPDPALDKMLFPQRRKPQCQFEDAGSSGGYLHHVAQTIVAQNPGSRLAVQRGRNADVTEYTVVGGDQVPLFRGARYYGFRNIQNLVRKLRPAKQGRLGGVARRPAGRPGATKNAVEVDAFDYVEVMACPGGCTNGGGQIKVQDLVSLGAVGSEAEVGPKEWLKKVDEAYFSMDEEADAEASDAEADEGEDDRMDVDSAPVKNGLIDGVDSEAVRGHIKHWVDCTGIESERLLCTTYRQVESEVGKTGTEVERVVQLASGW